MSFLLKTATTKIHCTFHFDINSSRWIYVHCFVSTLRRMTMHYCSQMNQASQKFANLIYSRYSPILVPRQWFTFKFYDPKECFFCLLQDVSQVMLSSGQCTAEDLCFSLQVLTSRGFYSVLPGMWAWCHPPIRFIHFWNDHSNTLNP